MLDLEQDIEIIQDIYNIIVQFLVTYSFQLLGALLVLLIGMFVANRVARAVLKLCEAKQLDVTLSRFTANVVKVLIIVMVAVICLNMIGISITPLVAAIGAASLGAGLAVQGLLSNYGAGLNIILARPFVVGDTITVQGVSGQVKDIHLAFTVLLTEDAVEITIPNKYIVGEIFQNSHKETLVELSVGVSYSSDIKKVITLLENALKTQELCGDVDRLQVGILEFADSAVNLQIRCWAPTDQVNKARFTLNQLIWDTLKENHVEIPFPQREINILEKSV